MPRGAAPSRARHLPMIRGNTCEQGDGKPHQYWDGLLPVSWSSLCGSHTYLESLCWALSPLFRPLFMRSAPERAQTRFDVVRLGV